MQGKIVVKLSTPVVVAITTPCEAILSTRTLCMTTERHLEVAILGAGIAGSQPIALYLDLCESWERHRSLAAGTRLPSPRPQLIRIR